VLISRRLPAHPKPMGGKLSLADDAAAAIVSDRLARLGKLEAQSTNGIVKVVRDGDVRTEVAPGGLRTKSCRLLPPGADTCRTSQPPNNVARLDQLESFSSD
jgi:hypothetical protein